MTLDHKALLQQLRDQRRTARGLALTGADLRGVQLAGLRADGLDLAEADLRESALTGVRWKACTLRDARLDAADLTGAVLRLCDLDQVRGTGVLLTLAHVENCTARGTCLDGADLTGAILTDTDFSRASLRGAILTGVSASGASFRGADLRGARLQNAHLADCDLRGADLTDADLTGADLRGADLAGCVGLDPVLCDSERAWGELPPSMQPLAETVAPIVQEVLQTAGQSGAIDPATAMRLREEAARYRAASPRSAPAPDTLAAVARVLGQLGDSGLPALLGALQQPGQDAPPPEVQAMILGLRAELGLDPTATTEDVFNRLVQGIGRPPQKP